MPNQFQHPFVFALCLSFLSFACSCSAQTESETENSKSKKPVVKTLESEPGTSSTRKQDKPKDKEIVPKLTPIKWDGEARTLLPKKEFGKWEAISFGGEGDCHVQKSVLTIESGDPMTGIRLPVKDLPKTDYEITLEARRMDGIDFFCGLTFPVNEEHCCLIVGGWSGAVVGLSNIDDEDASSNPSRKLMTFEDERWYKIRVRVLAEQIIVWIDEKCVVDQNIKGKKISLRGDTLSCRPLGLCTFQTTSETRNLAIRKFKSVNAAHDNPKDRSKANTSKANTSNANTSNAEPEKAKMATGNNDSKKSSSRVSDGASTRIK